MFPAPSSWGLPPPWLQMSQPIKPGVVSFWEADHFRENLRRLQETLRLVKAVQKELETIILVREFDGQDDKPSSLSKYSGNEDIVREFLKVIGEKGMDMNIQESFSLEAANSLIRSLREQLTPFSIVSSQTSSWEERSVAARLAQKLQKSKRNKRWRKKKRKRIAEKNSKEREMFDKADQEADEWRAKEIAKNIARRKVEKMKVIAMFKAKEERKRLESELELVLVVEKLQELRSIRIQKLKKQGHFFPEEDDKFLERVRAAVEEEERQTAAAPETSAAKDAIATAEESRKASNSGGSNLIHDNGSKGEVSTSGDQKSKMEDVENLRPASLDSQRGDSDQQGHDGGYDSVACLPFEFYHYYHGSNYDLGTLIEVCQMSDELGMHISGLEAVEYLGTGFGHHHLQMRSGLPIWLAPNLRLTESNSRWSSWKRGGPFANHRTVKQVFNQASQMTCGCFFGCAKETQDFFFKAATCSNEAAAFAVGWFYLPRKFQSFFLFSSLF